MKSFLVAVALGMTVIIVTHITVRVVEGPRRPRPVLTIVAPVPLWGVPACHRMAASVNADIARCEGALDGCQHAARIPEDCHTIVARLGCDWDHGRAQLLKDCPGISGAGVYK